MNLQLGLRVLSQIMKWGDEESRREFKWLEFMSNYKYDGYRDYLAGVRFIERLATWLQQFDIEDRGIAYSYIKEYLIYISPAEIERLVSKFYPEIVQRHIVETVSTYLNIAKHKIWSSDDAINEFDWQIRKTLFMGLSDGARIDILRRENTGILSNEQVVATSQIDNAKWTDLLNDLRDDLKKKREKKGENAKFSRIYLIDDFTGSGTSLIRYKEKDKKFKGKLKRFYESINSALEYKDILEDDWELVVHHYIGTEHAEKIINERYNEAVKKEGKWVPNIKFTFGIILPTNISLNTMPDHPFHKICKKYYDSSIVDKHAAESGNPDMTYGYGQCALPLVLEHNTPNNSLPLIWAETQGHNGKHAMRPLFRRRQRHTEIME